MLKTSRLAVLIILVITGVSCGNPAADYIAQGDALYEQGKLDEAIAEYTLAIEADPENAEAYNKRGLIYGQKGELDKAISDAGCIRLIVYTGNQYSFIPLNVDSITMEKHGKIHVLPVIYPWIPWLKYSLIH